MLNAKKVNKETGGDGGEGADYKTKHTAEENMDLMRDVRKLL